LARFFVVRDAVEQRNLLDRLVEAGWESPLPLTGSYWWFRRSRVADREFEDEAEEVIE
jgi:hypothetical protein